MRNAAKLRQAVSQQFQYKTYDRTIPSPVAGWVTARNLAEPIPRSVITLENWFPERRAIRLRGGTRRKATVHASNPVQSIFSYEAGAIKVLFAATADSIFDITLPATPTTIPTADITGQTSGYYSTAPFANASNDVFLSIFNGTDQRQVYDGSAWSTSPAITGITGDTNGNTISHGFVFSNRLFLVQKDTMNVWYLPADNIGGAVSGVISLAGVFQLGGSVLTGGTWSVNAGDGMHDQCVFISTLGEVAVYQGTDPSDASKWARVGDYHTGTMLGKNAILSVAGDLLLLTVDGMIPMSVVQRIDRGALSLNAISQNIEPDWHREAVGRPDNWTVVKWAEKNMTIVALPTMAGFDQMCFVVNSETGAWCKYTGLDTNCITLFDGYAYFGTSTGTIMKCESGGQDDGANYTCTLVGSAEEWGTPAYKNAQLMRTTFKGSTPFTPKISVVTNYSGSLPNAPSAAMDVASEVWDVGLWDVMTFDSTGTVITQTRWRSVYGAGFTMSPVIQVTCGSTTLPDQELVSSQVRFGVGSVVT